MSPDDRARTSAQAMWDGDAASKWMGFELIEVSEGRAVLTLAVAPRHCNGHGTCHGGVIFALADSAFAFACNSRNQSTVAQHATVSFTAPARSGDVLRAEAREVSLTGRSGLYDVSVTTGDGDRVAEFRGMSRAIPGHLFEETP
ncbi:MAG: hydroxyphenylacetyl-CoA thioesterase PaaI [Jannaschia sp.]